MKKMNKKGFTLIEILAVMVIIAALVLIAVPAVRKYIDNSKKHTYESTLRNMVSTLNNEIISGHRENYKFDEENAYFVMPLVCIELEKGDNKKSPFDNYLAAYSFIIVESTANGYSYKVQALDESGYGTYLIKPEDIKIEELKTDNLDYITKNIDDNNKVLYEIEHKNYNNTKSPSIFTCETLNDVEINAPYDEEN